LPFLPLSPKPLFADGGGTSESRVAEVESVVRKDGRIMDTSRLLVATKFMPTWWRWTERSFFRSLEGSLKRLRTDCIDLYFIHTPVHPLPLEFWVRCAAKAQKMGLVKAIGLSNCNSSQVERAHKAAAELGVDIAANQIMFNLLDFNSDELQKTMAVCHRLCITVIAYAPLGQGLLTENLTPDNFSSIRAVRMTGVKFDELTSLRTRIATIAKAHGKTMAQVCLNWTICHGAIPLVGVKNERQGLNSAGCIGWSLTKDDVDALDEEALGLATLNKPKRRRMIFVVAIGFLLLAYRTVITLGNILPAPLSGYFDRRHSAAIVSKKHVREDEDEQKLD